MENKPQPLLNVNLRWFLLNMVLANIAAMMAFSMMSLYLVDLGASVGQVGLVFTAASLVPTALQIFGGWFSDTIGRLKAIAIGSVFGVFGFVIFFISPSWKWVLVGVCVEEISTAFVAPSFGAYIAEQSSETARGRVYGVARGIYMVVTVIGPTLAGLLVQHTDFRFMLKIAFAFYLAATLVRIWMGTAERFTASKPAEKPTLTGLKTQLVQMAGLLLAGGILTWIWVTDAINDTTFNLTTDLFPIYLSNFGHLSVQLIGLLGSAWGLASILGSFAGGWLTDRRSERSIIAAGFALVTLGLAAMLLVHNLAGFFFARSLNGLGVGLLGPAYDSLVSKVVPENKRGLAFGLFGSSMGILSLPMPWIGAQLWERIAPVAPFWVTVAICAISVPIVLLKFRRTVVENVPESRVVEKVVE